MKGYKVFNPDFTCKSFQFKEGETYEHKGKLEICQSGFHFCQKASHCFSYYSFDSKNIVCEVEALGDIVTHEDDSKVATNKIKIIRKLEWLEVLMIANEGKNNTGHSNSGDSNSGYRNSGNWNSGNWNSGDSNSGNRNSGNWNSGYRNSGDSNSGYRNSGAFCSDPNPKLVLFDKLTDINVKDWEESEAVQTMNKLLTTAIWIYSSDMTPEEKECNPKHETTGGFLKVKTMKEAWADMWHNLSEDKRKLFTDLPNFSSEKFEEITGIKV